MVCWLVLGFLVFYAKGLHAKLGEQCLTPNKGTGVCQALKSCSILYDAIASENGPDPVQIQFIRESFCDYDGSSYAVCCGDTANFTSSLLPDRSTCGIQSANRIIGGETTDMDEFPWMVRLKYFRSDNSTVFACGGSLISNRYVLTAAHCVSKPILAVREITLGGVRLGEWFTGTNPDCSAIISTECNDPYVDVNVEEAIAHPKFDNSNLNDIALIRMAEEVKFTDYIKPICIPLLSEIPNVGTLLTVSGWGQTETELDSKYKLKVSVPLVPRSRCSQIFHFNLQFTQICAGGLKEKDSCRGDSGGPLMGTVKTDSSQWLVLGIVSFGSFPCGLENRPGVYTSVASYYNWISSTLRL